MADGPDTEYSTRHVLRFVLSEGLRVGHAIHWGRQETRWSSKGSSGDPQCTGSRCGERPAYLDTTRVHLYEAATNGWPIQHCYTLTGSASTPPPPPRGNTEGRGPVLPHPPPPRRKPKKEGGTGEPAETARGGRGGGDRRVAEISSPGSIVVLSVVLSAYKSPAPHRPSPQSSAPPRHGVGLRYKPSPSLLGPFLHSSPSPRKHHAAASNPDHPHGSVSPPEACLSSSGRAVCPHQTRATLAHCLPGAGGCQPPGPGQRVRPLHWPLPVTSAGQRPPTA